MTADEREKSQASFMQPGRKVVMLATNAFGLGVDKPDIRYVIHYQVPGSLEAYVQEAGRAGRDGKPARCVLLFQPDDIAIQEHFLKEAHPTKTQARMVAEGLYAWSDEGKEVSVRDLALSMALPERRVRVILSVLEAMGVAEEVKAARWKGVEPKPTREQIDKAAMVFEARRISDRRRLASLLSYMNTQKCRVQMLRSYFGEPEGEQCGLCDSDAGLDSEVFDPGSADERHGLHAATDFHARPRRRRRGRGGGYEAPMAASARRRRATTAAVRDRRFRATCLPPLPPCEIPAPADSEQTFDEGSVGSRRRGRRRADARRRGRRPGRPRDGRQRRQRRQTARRRRPTEDFTTGWAAVRDANIRPYAEWRPGAPVTLPVLAARPLAGRRHQGNHPGHHGHGRRRAAAVAGGRPNRGGGGRPATADAAAAAGASKAAAASESDSGRRDLGAPRSRSRATPAGVTIQRLRDPARGTAIARPRVPALPRCLRKCRAATSVPALPGGD